MRGSLFKKIKLMSIIILIFWLVFYIFFQSNSVYGGDAGDFITAAYLKGIPHPPGFPLYTLLAYLLIKLPINTVAWRTTLLSSIPSALSLHLLYLILLKIHPYKNRLIPIFGVMILGFTYPFWLYSSFTEVYALNVFFSLLLVYLLLLWSIYKKNKYLYFFLLTLGFALAHHQLILFLLPGLFYLIIKNKRFIPKKKLVFLITVFFLVSLGFLTYLYSYIAAQSYPLNSWNNPANVRNLIKLIAKETYGVVYSGPSFAKTAGGRLLNIPAYFLFVIEDFTVVGFALITLGFIYYLVKLKKNKYSIFFILLFLFTGPLLYFYASFTLDNELRIAIFEQFLTLSYIFLVIYLCQGMEVFQSFFALTIRKLRFSKSISGNSLALFNILFLLFTLTVFYINYPKISVLKNDRTAENFGTDILNSAEKNSILIVTTDTTLFNTQYMYYVYKVNPTIKLFHFEKLLTGDYNNQIIKYYPEIELPDNESGIDFIRSLFNKNYEKFPIYSNIPIEHGMTDFVWVRYGLLYRLLKRDQLPSEKDIIDRNNYLWGSYQNPQQGSLNLYPNLDLVNVLSFYEFSHREYASFLINAHDDSNAVKHLDEAIKLKPRTRENYLFKAQAFINLGKCQEADDVLNSLQQIDSEVQPADYYLRAKVQRDCFKDLEKAKFFFGLYDDAYKKKEKLLKEL